MHQFVHGETDGPVPFHYPGGDTARIWIASLGNMTDYGGNQDYQGDRACAINAVWRLGYATRFLFSYAAVFGHGFRRFRLIIRELYFTGVLSLIIIMVRDCSSAWCWACRATRRSSATVPKALGMLVALSLVRELGPVVAALLFASRAGSAMTAEIGLMKATEQMAAMEMMAVDPIARVVAPRFWAGVISMPLLAAMFSAMGVFGGYLVGVVLIGVDEGSFWSQMQAAVDFREDILNGVIKSVVFGVAVTDRAVRGLRCAADGGRRIGRDHAHRGDLVAGDLDAGFHLDRIHV